MQVYVESLWEGVDFSTTLSRARFDGLAAGTMAVFVQLAKEAVQRCGLSEAQISKVMLYISLVGILTMRSLFLPRGFAQ